MDLGLGFGTGLGLDNFCHRAKLRCVVVVTSLQDYSEVPGSIQDLFGTYDFSLTIFNHRLEKLAYLKTFLKWQSPSWAGSIKHCFSVSFDFYNDLDILMYEITLDFNEETVDRFNIASTDDCFLVFVGGKYVHMIDQVVRKVEIIGKKILSKARILFLDTNDKKRRNMKETYPPLVLD